MCIKDYQLSLLELQINSLAPLLIIYFLCIEYIQCTYIAFSGKWQECPNDNSNFKNVSFGIGNICLQISNKIHKGSDTQMLVYKFALILLDAVRWLLFNIVEGREGLEFF